MARARLIGAIEAGGSKFVCAIHRTTQEIRNPTNQCRAHHYSKRDISLPDALLSSDGTSAANCLPQQHPAWKLETDYLAQGLVNILTTVSPQLIILGGSVMNRRLHRGVQPRVRELLLGYIDTPQFDGDAEKFPLLPAWRSPEDR